MRQLLETVDSLQHKLKEVNHARDDLENRCRELERVKLENDRLTQIEILSKRLKEQKREDDF